MSRKRPLDNSRSEPSTPFLPFKTFRDKELFEIERNILARMVYKSHYQYRRIDVFDRLKRLIKLADDFLTSRNANSVPDVISAIEIAAERFFQQISMGLMITQSMTCVAALGRLMEIMRRVPFTHSQPTMDDDEGVPVER
jgi:hypothetical protein